MAGSGYLSTVRGLNRDTRLVIATWMLSSFGTIGIDGVLGNLYVLRLGYGTEFLGLVNAVILLSMGLASLPAGELGRRWGYRRAMVLGLAMATLGLGLVPAAMLLVGWARGAWLIAAYAVAYVGTIVRAVNSAPYLMRVTSQEERGHAFAVQNAIAPAGAFLGSVAAGVLPAWFAGALGVPSGDAAPYGLSLLVAASMLAPSVPAMLLAREAPCEVAAGAAAERGDGRAPLAFMALVAAVLLLAALGDGPVGIYFNTYLDEALHTPTSLIGALMALGRLVAIPATLLAPIVMARWGHARAYAIATAAGAVSLLPLVLFPCWQAAAVSFIALVAFVGMGSPAMVVFHQSLVAPRWRATMSGMVTMLRTLGLAAMCYAAGGMIAHSGYGTMFRFAAVAMAAAAGVFWLLFCRRRQPGP